MTECVVQRHYATGPDGVRLHYVEAGGGDGAEGRPAVVLLHGFPEFWYSWRRQLPALAAAGFRAIAVDLRGYNLSDKPPRVADYRVERLAGDVLALIDQVAGGRAHVVGHDWGGVVAWWLAMHHPRAVEKLAVLNAPHPATYLREARRPRQLLRSWYVLYFQLPWLPEAGLRVGDFMSLRRLFRTDPAQPAAFSEDDIDLYAMAFSRRPTLTAAINYYRAAFRRGPWHMARGVRPVEARTLLIWGERDRYLVPELTQGLEKWVPNLRVERLPRASHWVQHDEPDRVNDLLIGFFGRGSP
jgi:pimeloyl-ACP methyl ester carboxylesterase